jgi:hypothetical protein
MDTGINSRSSNATRNQFNGESDSKTPEPLILMEASNSKVAVSDKLALEKTTEEKLKSSRSPLDNFLSDASSSVTSKKEATWSTSKGSGIDQTTRNINLSTNDPIEIANALGAKIIPRQEALGLDAPEKNTKEIYLGEQPIEVNIKTDKLNLVRHGDELFSRKVTGVYIKNDANGKVISGKILLDPDPAQELSTLVSRKEALKNELKDLQHARNNIKVDPREKQSILVYSGELGLTVKGTNINFRLKASNVSELTATGGNEKVGFDTKGRIESKYGDAAKTKVPFVKDDANTRVDIGSFATENGAILFGTPLPKVTLPIGSVKAKLEGGINLLEFANQVAEPVRVGVKKIDLLITLTNEITYKQTDIDSLQTKIEHFEPQLDPVTINFKGTE